MNHDPVTWISEFPPINPIAQWVGDPVAVVYGLAWFVYVIIYWICLGRIVRANRFEATDKILWFLVITMAPVIGIITFWWICPAFVLNKAPHEKAGN